MINQQRAVTALDAVICGAGPAGAAAAILLARAGWRVLLVEQQAYPRQKVCGECMSASSLALLDALGIGAAVRQRAGPELRQVAWMRAEETIIADLPPCTAGPYAFGRALGRDQLDALLVERARGLGVALRQPAKLKAVRAHPAGFECFIAARGDGPAGDAVVSAPIVIDAHGSWEAGPLQIGARAGRPLAAPLRSRADLFGFKASFQGSTLPAGLLPVLSFAGGYGGLVQAEDGRLTLACCIRRDTLRDCRARAPGQTAGAAVERYLRASCGGVDAAVLSARRRGPWYCVGPVRPGIRGVADPTGPLCIGNAAGETHPLIGEGITMALQSAFLLALELTRRSPARIDADARRDIGRRYAAAWRATFVRRLRFAALYAHLAMHPALSRPAAAVLRRWPGALTGAARWAGKAGAPSAPCASPSPGTAFP
jgi:2-polyprenyl-6-methoxyphenol hydroxylase-like FAD-dependent oxidoreductase